MGTTAEKLTYLNNTKLAIKNELNKLGADIEDSDTFRSYVNSLETIYSEYPTVDDIGSSIVLNKTKKAPLKSITLNSTELTQDGTPTPDDPVDVNVIKGDNNVKIVNENLFTTTNNFSLVTGYASYEILGTNSLSVTSTGSTYSYRYVRFKLNNLVVGQRYYVSANFVNSDDTTTIPLYIKNTADNTTLNANDSFESGSYLSFTATETNAMIRFYASGDTAKINTCTWTNIMVSTSNTTEYVEHQEQNYPISLASKNLFNPNYYLDRTFSTGVYKYTLSDVIGNRTLYFKGKLKEGKTNISGLYISLTSLGYNPNQGTSCYAIRNGNPAESVYVSANFTGINNLYISYYPTTINWSEIDETYDFWIATSDIDYVEYQIPIEYCEIGNYADQISNQFESKNLFDYTRIANAPIWPDWESSGGRQLEFIVKSNTQYTLSSNVPQGSSTLLYFNGSVTATNGVWVNNPKTMTSNANGILYVYFFNNRDYYNDIKNGTYYIQLEEGDTATEFMPYGITKGEWYLKKNIGKVVLNGSETYVNKNITDTNIIFQTTIPTALNNSTSFSNYFKEVSFLWDVDVQGMVFYTNVFRMRIDKTLLSDVTTQQNAINSFKSWLSQNNVNVYYVLTIPTYTHISQEDYPTLRGQLDNLYNNAKSYNEQTNITQTNTDLPFSISVSALLKGDI